MVNDDIKIEGTTENWESRKLGADERYARAVSPEEDQKLNEALKDEIVPKHTAQGKL